MTRARRAAHCLLGAAFACTSPFVQAPLARAQTAAAGSTAPVVPVARQTMTGAPSGGRMAGQAGFIPRTLQEALAAAYSTNPTLLEERARLRATDENVPTALAGWRPQISVTGYGGYTYESSRQGTSGVDNTPYTTSKVYSSRPLATAQATLNQPIYRGGKTTSQTHQAVNAVYAERANLIATEETVFTNVVSAYVTLIENQNLLLLNISNEQVLTKQLQATNDRFRVGEITRTDVAQAEAALAGAREQREVAEGNVQTARATYLRYVGAIPADGLIEPQPLKLPVKTELEANKLAGDNNPAVVQALFNDSAAKDAVDVAFSNLMPQVSLQAQGYREDNSLAEHERIIGAQATLNLTVPIYQGGSEYAAVRQARQSEQQSNKAVDDARRQALQQATQAWETYIAARAAIESAHAQIRSNEIALEGTQREAIVGSRTTLDVLNAEQALLTSRTTLIQNLASLVTASYGVASAVGRLTAKDLGLNVPIYDETAYYNAVRDRLWGTGDFATDQPGR